MKRVSVEPSGQKEKGQTKNKLEKRNRMGIAEGRMKLERSKRTSLGQNQIGEHYVGRMFHIGRKGENDYYDDDNDDDESGGVCGTYWGEKRCVQGFAGET